MWSRLKLKQIISAAEWVLKLFQNYFSDNEGVGKYSWAAISLLNNFEIILFDIKTSNIFMKFCRIVDYCYEKNPLNIVVDSTQNCRMSAIFDFCYNILMWRFKSPSRRSLVYQATPTLQPIFLGVILYTQILSKFHLIVGLGVCIRSTKGLLVVLAGGRQFSLPKV